MGRTTPVDGYAAAGAPLLRLRRNNRESLSEAAGFASVAYPIFGCYLHGLFESPAVRIGLFRWLAARKGLDWKETVEAANPDAMGFSGLPATPGTSRDGNEGLDRIANALEAILDPSGFLSDLSPTPQNFQAHPLN